MTHQKQFSMIKLMFTTTLPLINNNNVKAHPLLNHFNPEPLL